MATNLKMSKKFNFNYTVNNIFSLIFGQGNYNDVFYIGALFFFVILCFYIKINVEKIFF